MFSHVTIGTNDLQRGKVFYDAALKTLGHECFSSGSHFSAYGRRNGEQIWIILPFDGKKSSVGNGTHIAFIATDRKSVNNFHTKALKMGGTNEGFPGLRPQYHAGYYGAYIRDPDGNKIQAVCHKNIKDLGS